MDLKRINEPKTVIDSKNGMEKRQGTDIDLNGLRRTGTAQRRKRKLNWISTEFLMKRTHPGRTFMDWLNNRSATDLGLTDLTDPELTLTP